MNALLAIGRVSKLYGMDGEVTLNIYDTFPDKIDKQEPMWVVIDTLSVPLFIDTFERRGRKRAQVRFADIDTPARAEELIGQEISVKSGGANHKAIDKQAERREDGEFLFEDLIGYNAIIKESSGDPKLTPLLTGTITDFIDSEMNPLIEVEVDGKHILVPAVDEFIISIDTQNQRVEFSIPEGLLELYL